MTLTWEAVAAFLVVLTFVSGVWWRVEGMIRKNTDDLAAHKLHTAETYVTKVGLTEQTNQLIKAIDAVSAKIDYTNGRLDSMMQPATSRSRNA